MGLQEVELYWITCDGKGCWEDTKDGYLHDCEECEYNAMDKAEKLGWSCSVKRMKSRGEWLCPECTKKAEEKNAKSRAMLASGKLPLPGQVGLFDGAVVPHDAYPESVLK